MSAAPHAVEESLARQAFERVFTRPEPYETPFPPAVPHRAIVYPFEVPVGDPLPHSIRAGLDAVATLARAARDDGFYRTYFATWSEGEPRASFVPLDAVPDQYRQLDQYLEEVALVSPSGRWGVMVDEDRWALVGTDTSDLLEVFLDAFPPTPDAPRIGLRVVSEGHDRTWQPLAGVPAREQVRLFLSLYDRICRDEARAETREWLERLLEHVYDAERTHELMRAWREVP
jgi:hypothetical protein